MRAGQGWAEPVAEALAARKQDQAGGPCSPHPRGVASLGHGPRPDAHHDPCPSSPRPLNPAAKTLGGLCFQLLRGGARQPQSSRVPPSQSISSQCSPAGPALGPKSRPRKGGTQGSRDSAGPGRWWRFSVPTGDKAFHCKSFFFFFKLIQSISGAGKNTPEVSIRGPFASPSACEIQVEF